MRIERMEQILAPTNCPSCDSNLEFINELLYCFNKMCPAQWDKKLQHFASSLKIKGLGPSTIKKLDLLDYPELYELSVGEITVRLGSEKLATKLVNEIEKSKTIDLQTLLPWDKESVYKSIKKTNRALIIHEANQTGGIGAEISASINQDLFEYLDAPVDRLCSIDIPTPFDKKLEQEIFWPKNKIINTIKKIITY